MYRNAFSLRRAPFFLSYAVYSAVTVVLNEEDQHRREHASSISFFWTCLNELNRGSNHGLNKPLTIIRDVVNELQISIAPEGSPNSTELELQPRLDQSSFALSDLQPAAPIMHEYAMSGIDDWSIIAHSDPLSGLTPGGNLDFLNQQEIDLSNDTLYGLFAPTQQSVY
jgi:hypothetical protein